ncbi:MAG: hypothetical protein H6550_14485 [Chitinophagales bacterium]|nr:hypothetical protein [Chitinophagales bacterium]
MIRSYNLLFLVLSAAILSTGCASMIVAEDNTPTGSNTNFPASSTSPQSNNTQPPTNMSIDVKSSNVKDVSPSNEKVILE